MYFFILIAVGHSASSPSASRHFHFSEDHPLISTSRDRGALGWDMFLIHNLKDMLPLYNLEELFTFVNFTTDSCERFSQKVEASGKLSHDCHSIAWVSSLIPQHLVVSKNLTFTSDVEVKSLAEALVTFKCSLKNRPDGAVLHTFHCDGREWKLPLFIVEVHSNDYRITVSQTTVDLIDQLRLLRCFNRNISKCVGFAFPKYPEGSAPNKSCVTKVVVSFERFKFVVCLFPLHISDVKKEIERTVSMALEFCAECPQFCFLRLSDSDLQFVHHRLNVHNQKLCQHSSQHSIVLRNSEVFWKHIPNMKQADTLLGLKESIKSNPRHIVLFSNVVWVPRFFSFPAQLPPLSRVEVSVCLIDFMVKTASALQELHGFGYAHLDVRVPNICFSQEKNTEGEYDAKLIDLDRCVDVAAWDVSGYVGELYRCPQHWNTDKLDWKQLGLLAGRVVTKYQISDGAIIHSMLVSGDQCLRELISEGMILIAIENSCMCVYLLVTRR